MGMTLSNNTLFTHQKEKKKHTKKQKNQTTDQPKHCNLLSTALDYQFLKYSNHAIVV